jgi:hypothetical protein
MHKNITGLESISSELEAQLEIYLKMFALLYADDTVLMSETSDGLQTLLNNFYEYSKLWKLKSNIDKTKIMVFSTSRTAENVHFLYNEKEIETVTEFNYLGVTFTKKSLTLGQCRLRIKGRTFLNIFPIVLLVR